jgi:hypothetical protein
MRAGASRSPTARALRSRSLRARTGGALLALLATGCASEPPANDPAGAETGGARAADPVLESVDARCALPDRPTGVHREGPDVLLVWELPAGGPYDQPVLPGDSAFLAYRAAVRADDADLERPVADRPEPTTPEEAALWQDEDFNADLAHGGSAGTIAPITCLDALLFAYQNRRVSQLERPTEFIASVLVRDEAATPRVTVVFGAGEEAFPPRSVYGFDVVERYLEEGWRYAYLLHNHTLQRNGSRLALGTPAPSTSDVGLVRSLVADLGLEGARVTNGFYTFAVPAEELPRFRSR